VTAQRVTPAQAGVQARAEDPITFLLIVIARLVRATHEHLMMQAGQRNRRRVLGGAETMGGPDKPGHDDPK
jgi:hypothetical protein